MLALQFPECVWIPNKINVSYTLISNLQVFKISRETPEGHRIKRIYLRASMIGEIQIKPIIRKAAQKDKKPCGK